MEGKALTPEMVNKMSPEMRAHMHLAGYRFGAENCDSLFRRLHAMAGLLRQLDEHLVAIALEVERRANTAAVVARGELESPPAYAAPPAPPRDAQDELAARVDQLQEMVAQFIARGGPAGAAPAAEAAAGLTAAQRERQTALERERRQRDEARNAAQVSELEANDGGFRGGWGSPKG